MGQVTTTEMVVDVAVADCGEGAIHPLRAWMSSGPADSFLAVFRS